MPADEPPFESPFDPDDVRRLLVYLGQWIDAGQQLPIGALTAMGRLRYADAVDRGPESDAT